MTHNDDRSCGGDCLDTGRDALVLFAELIVSGERHELYERARRERDALVCLLDEASPEMLPAVEELLDRFDVLMKALAN